LVWVVLIGIFVYYSIPSFAVILSAFADIVMTLAVVDMAGMNLSIAGVIAFLMLIGYSVDTDILLTSRLLKDKEGNVNHRLFGAFKTGITMTLTAIAAVGVSLIIIYNFSSTLKQIFTIILIGLGFDIINTWITNASVLKWYMGVKKLE
jgi:preprotein translocase subunit SecF